MKSDIIIQLHKNFEDYANQIDGEEFWFARDLQGLLGYSKWENFAKVIDKAKIACQTAGHSVADHFPDVRKTIPMPKGAEKEIDDHMLTRYVAGETCQVRRKTVSESGKKAQENRMKQ